MSIAAPALMHDFGMPPEQMGFLLSAFFWTYGAFQLPAGFIVDRLGVRRSYFFAFLLWSLASAATALSRNVETIFGLRLLLGVAESVGPLASLAFIRLAFSEHERGLPVSAYIAGQNLGPAIGTLLGSMLLAGAGWRVMFAVTGLGALLWLPFWFFLAKWTPLPATVVAATRRRWNWRAILACPSFWAMSVCVFLFSYYWYFLLTWIPTYLTMSRGLSVIAMGRILFVPLFTMAPINIGIGWLADRMVARQKNALPVRIGIAVAGFLLAGSILLVEHVSGRVSILAVLTVSVCSFGVASASFWTIVQHVAPAHLTARTIAYFNTISQAAGATAPILTGHTLGPGKNFALAILLAGLGAIAASSLLLACGSRGVGRLAQELNS